MSKATELERESRASLYNRVLSAEADAKRLFNALKTLMVLFAPLQPEASAAREALRQHREQVG